MFDKEIMVIADSHVARIWDKIGHLLPDESFLNPNENLKQVLKHVKKNQLLVINGDQVDYYYSGYYPNHPSNETNWDLFYEIIGDKRPNILCTPGNHDYRSYPYNFSLYKLKHVNVPENTRRTYKNQIGFCDFRYLSELKSVMVNVRKFNPLHKFYFQEYYHADHHGTDLVFLNTGPDALTMPVHLLKIKYWPLMFVEHPILRGIGDEQINMLHEVLHTSPNKEVIIFMHCPPFFGMKEIEEVKLEHLTYTLELAKNRMNFGVFLENNWQFIHELLKSDKNIIVITSHTHIPRQYIIDKETQLLRESDIDDINIFRDEQRYIKFVGTMPLGAIRFDSTKIGFLKIGKKIEYTTIRDYADKKTDGIAEQNTIATSCSIPNSKY